MEKKLDGNCTRLLWAILNKSWRQHPTKQQLYGPLPPITKTIQFRRTRHVGHCWRSKDELISDIPQWSPSYGRVKAEWPARTYIQQFCTDTRCSLEDLPQVMDDREGWQERVREIHTGGTTLWLWWRMLNLPNIYHSGGRLLISNIKFAYSHNHHLLVCIVTAHTCILINTTYGSTFDF